MWILTRPNVNDVDDHLTKALTKANGEIICDLSASERSAVLAVYEIYDALLGQPDSSLKPAELTSCREHIEKGCDQVKASGRLAVLRDTLFTSIIECPYCGFGELAELDHYLPKTEFKELAIYPRNLIPCCGVCNKAKGTIVPGGPLGHRLIHAYFQELPKVKFMCAEVECTGDRFKVTYRIDPAKIDSTLADMLQFQLERLKLNDRYEHQIHKFLFEQRAGMLRDYRPGRPPDQFIDYLLAAAKDMENNFGLNDWRPALLEGLASNEMFCTEPKQYFGERPSGG